MASLEPSGSIFDAQTCTRRGFCPVTPVRDQRGEPLESHSLYFEVHGSGPQKIMFIMGANYDCFAWLPQLDHFRKLKQYSTLVFDNRGVGRSLVRGGRYTSSGMAEDTLCLLNHLEWTQDRSLHIVGLSLGGMAAQELALRIPNRIISLSLVATHGGGFSWANMPKPSLCLNFARLLSTPDIEKHFPVLEDLLFPKEWMDSLAEGDPQGRTNREVEQEHFRRRMEISGPQTLRGALGQMAAIATHNMSPKRLAKISVPKVFVLGATEDAAIAHTECEKLKHHIPGAEYQCWDKTGHGICVQHKERFNKLLERVFQEGKEAADKRVASK